MRVLVTGASGFIGSYLTNFLSQRGITVIASCRDKRKLLQSTVKYDELIELDVLSNLESEIRADAVVHLATPNDIFSQRADEGVKLVAIGTKNLLDYAVRNQIPNVIFFSTLQVYGVELSGTVTEGSPTNPWNDYGISHLFGEMYVEMYARQGKVNAVSLRPSNIHGPFMIRSINRWTLVPGCFCRDAFERKTIAIKSSGRQIRNFLHLENLSRSIECVLQNFRGGYDVVNAASSESLSILDVADEVKEIYESAFNQRVQVVVEGVLPAIGNVFQVSLDKLINDYGYSEDRTFDLRRSIGELFHFLRFAGTD